MKRLALLIAVAALAGCHKAADQSANAVEPSSPPGATSTGGGGNVAPVGPAVGGITPMSGDVGGGSAGSVGQIAKDHAKSAAGTVMSGSTRRTDESGADPAPQGETGQTEGGDTSQGATGG